MVSTRDVLCISEFVATMPNGNPDFNVKELGRFFSALAAVLEGFAQRHNLRLEKYYHQAPSWGFLFRHPSGGVGKIEVQRVSEATVCILSYWWYDDFDAATRFIRSASVEPMPVNSEIAGELEHALSELLSHLQSEVPGLKSSVQELPANVDLETILTLFQGFLAGCGCPKIVSVKILQRSTQLDDSE